MFILYNITKEKIVFYLFWFFCVKLYKGLKENRMY